MTHLVSDEGALTISGDTLGAIAQRVLDAEQSRVGDDYDWNAFRNFLASFFSKPPKEAFLDKIRGADVAEWAQRLLIHERVRAARSGRRLDQDRCVIALMALMWTAGGQPVPDDIPI